MSRLIRTLFLLAPAIALFWRPAPVTAQTPLLEVEKGEEKLMQVNDDGGLVARGRLNNGVAPPAVGEGTRLMWYPQRSAFRVGSVSGAQWDFVSVGPYSIAMGLSTTASGPASTAMGIETTASAGASSAMGQGTTASHFASTAMGLHTTASGPNSTAMGNGTTASGGTSVAMGSGTLAGGDYSTAMGRETQAIGPNSTAMGFRTITHGERSTVMGSDASILPAAVGSFVYGDASTATDLVSSDPNEFAVRAAGGFRFRTSAGLGTGCNLPPGSGTFDCTSSRLAKEGFEDLHGETVLGKLAAMRIQRWRYRGTQTSHVGPTAEDFHAAFELGEGPTTISTVDADGISLLAVQALERRTAELREENAALQTQLEELRRIVMENRRVTP